MATKTRKPTYETRLHEYERRKSLLQTQLYYGEITPREYDQKIRALCNELKI